MRQFDHRTLHMDCLNKSTFTAQLIFNWRAAEVTAAHASTEKSRKHNVLSLKSQQNEAEILQ